MANEIRIASNFMLSKGNNLYQSNKSVSITQTGIGGPSPGTVTVGTTEETISLAELGNEGRAEIVNLDSTNFVDIGSATTNYMIRLKPGEPNSFRLKPGLTLYAKADMRHLEYRGGDNRLKIVPSGVGLPTIFDKDILIFCVSQLMHRKNRGEKIGKRVRFSARELMITTNRKTGGVEYQRLEQAFQRLMGTTFQTDIQTGNKRETRFFSLIESGSGFVMKGPR